MTKSSTDQKGSKDGRRREVFTHIKKVVEMSEMMKYSGYKRSGQEVLNLVGFK